MALPGNGWHCAGCGHQPAEIDGFLAFAPELARTYEGYAADRYALLFDLEADSFWFRSRNRLLIWAIGRYFGGTGRFCEVGCGTGYVLSALQRAFPHLSCQGTEVHTAGLLAASQRVPRERLLQLDARRMPFREEFDVVGAFDVIEHIEEDGQVLQQFHAATRAGGGLILTVPQHPWLWSAADDIAHHQRRYTAADLRAKVEAAGYEVVFCTSFVSLLLPVMLLARKMARVTRVGPVEEHRMGRFANAVLGAVMAVERFALTHGLRFPAGGSLLLVARKPGAPAA